MSNIWEAVDNGMQKLELVDLETVEETDLEQSYEKSYIVTKFKDTDRNNEVIDIKTQTIAKLTVSNSKNNIDVSNNRKCVFPNVSYANILKQPIVTREGLQTYLHMVHLNKLVPYFRLVNQIST